jgi:hypothetical protein
VASHEPTSAVVDSQAARANAAMTVAFTRSSAPSAIAPRFVKTYALPEGKVFTVVQELTGEDAEKFKTHSQELRTRYPNMKTLDLHNLVMGYDDETRLDLPAEDKDIVALREIYHKVNHVKAFPSHRWPSYREYARGDMGAPEPLEVTSTWVQKISKMSRAEVLEQLHFKKRLDDLPEDVRQQKLDQMKRLDNFFEQSLKKMAEMISHAQGLADTERNEDAKEQQLVAIRNLTGLFNQFKNGDRFPLYAAIVIEGDGAMKEDVALLKEVFKAEDAPLVGGFLAGTVLRNRAWDPKVINSREKAYMKDIALLNAKDKGEYLSHSKKLGHPTRRDSLAWVILNTLRQDDSVSAEKVFSEHPLIKSARLNSEMSDNLSTFVKDFV